MLYFDVKSSQIPLKQQIWRVETHHQFTGDMFAFMSVFNKSVGYFYFYYTPKSENVLITSIGLMLTKPLLSGPLQLPKMRLFVDYKDEKK